MLKDLFTVIYYTSNREDELFEHNIRADILSKTGDLPLVSVSQKPIDFGINICVGGIGASEKNLFRQVVTGCLYATTPFIITCEADCLYPKEYFNPSFPMEVTGRYFMENVWVFRPKANAFFSKGRSDCAKVAGRLHLISILMRQIENMSVPRHTEIKIPFKYPIINIKTGKGLRKNTQTSLEPHDSLPYWGSAEALKLRMGL